MKKIAFILISVCLFCSCKKDFIVNGYKPIYFQSDSVQSIIKNTQPIEIDNSGLIYRWNQYLLVNEVNKGIHVFDVSNPNNPVNLTFITIPNNTYFSIADSILYAENGYDLIAINISKILEVSVTDIQFNAFKPRTSFPDVYYNYHGRRNVYFECYDPTKGLLLGWEKADLINPKCKI